MMFTWRNAIQALASAAATALIGVVLLRLAAEAEIIARQTGVTLFHPFMQ